MDDNRYQTITEDDETYIYDSFNDKYFKVLYPNSLFDGEDLYSSYDGMVFRGRRLIYQETASNVPIRMESRDNYLVINGNENNIVYDKNTEQTTDSDYPIYIVDTKPRLLVETGGKYIFIFEKIPV